MQPDDDEPLDARGATEYRSAAARCNFLGLDRPDLQYAAKEISRSMANPVRGDMRKLHKIARYLRANPRAIFMYKHQVMSENLNIYSDANWAGCIKTRKSTQGGVCMIGQHCFKNWSSTQAIIATSSGEAEYYGLVKASSVGLGVVSMYRDMGVNVKLHVHTDAEAAKGIATRTGLGSMRHLAVHYLWVQERVRNGDIVLHKVRGDFNPADLLTKHLTRPTIEKYMSIIGLHYANGRSEVTPSLDS